MAQWLRGRRPIVTGLFQNPGRPTMADRDIDVDALQDLLGQTDALTSLVRDRDVFQSAFEAFRAEDAKGFEAALTKANLLPHCHRICHWTRIKQRVFLCLQLCGPPKPVDRAPNPRALVEAIVKITSDDKVVRQLADVVRKGDTDGFNA